MRREEWCGSQAPALDSDMATEDLSYYVVVSREAFRHRKSALADSRCDDDSQRRRSDTDGRTQE